jgi:ribosomal protein S18 acetylase RimI-like enzyme
MRWPYGRKLFTKRLMSVEPGAFRPAPPPMRVTIRAGGPAELDAVVGVDAVASESSDARQRPWLAPFFDQPSATVAVAELHGTTVATGYAVRSDGEAGPAGYVAGIAVLPQARRRGIGAAVSSWLASTLLDSGAELVHLHPDTENAARIYRRLGFAEGASLDIYLDNAPVCTKSRRAAPNP